MAIVASRLESFKPIKSSAILPIGNPAISAIECPLIVTASDNGLSLAPSQAAQGTSRMNPSKRSLEASLSDSEWRRSMYGITPS